MNDSGVDIWEQKYRSIGQDRNFLTGVTDEQNVYHESNITTTECKEFYHKLADFISQRMASKMSKRQSKLLQYFIRSDHQYKTISTITDKTIQNTHKMFNKDVAGKMRREVFRDKSVKQFIDEHAPEGLKQRLLKWFDKETSEHFHKKCCACGFKMTTEEAYITHLIKYEKIPLNVNSRKLRSYKNHQEIIRKQKRIVRKYFRYEHYTEANIKEFLVHADKYGFICNKAWILHYWPIRELDLDFE